jgi:radical SAM protein with 4Fe4S-binding SPASM domain
VIVTLSAPVLYALELTPDCNSHCAGCYNVFASERTSRLDVLSLHDWRLILERIRPHAHLIKLTGGEPTLYPHLDELIALLDDLGIAFSMFTNARWPDPRRTVERLRSSSCFRGLLVSLHGAAAPSHQAFSGVPGSFEEAKANVRLATGAGLSVVLSTVIHRHNLDELESVPALCVELGTEHVAFNRYLGPPLPQIEPSPAELWSAITRIEALRERGAPVKLGNCVPQCFVSSSATGCLAGVAYCTVDPWGNVRPCNHSPTRCGNLLEQPIEEIWYGDGMEAWRSGVPTDCHLCAAFSRCHGGCHAQAELLNLPGDPLMGEPLQDVEERVELYEGWRPLRACTVRPERFRSASLAGRQEWAGYVLLRGNHVVPIAPTDLQILEACDGKSTLCSLNTRFGQHGLRLIYELYRGGVVDMQE